MKSIFARLIEGEYGKSFLATGCHSYNLVLAKIFDQIAVGKTKFVPLEERIFCGTCWVCYPRYNRQTPLDWSGFGRPCAYDKSHPFDGFESTPVSANLQKI